MTKVEPSDLLDAIAARIRGGDVEGGYSEMFRIVRETPDREALYLQLIDRLGDPSFRVGACFAIAAGAIVEDGVDPEPLGRALRAPLTRALIAGKRCLDLAEELEDDLAIEGGVEIGDAQLSPEQMRQLIEKDPLALEAYFSMGTWYRPAIACWTRSSSSLREAQRDAEFQRALAAVPENVDEGAHWLSVLNGVAFGVPFILLLPELKKGFAFELDGCADCAQLSVLLADALGDVLDRLGCTSRPSKLMVEVMSGEGPQSVENTVFDADFQLYPWTAFGRTGGPGLALDFAPSAIELLDPNDPVDRTRVLILVGPKGTRGSKQKIGAARVFQALPARIDRFRALQPEDTNALMERIARIK